MQRKTEKDCPAAYLVAVHSLIHDSEVPLKTIAAHLGMSDGQLNNTALKCHPSAHLHAHLVGPATKLTGNTVLMDNISRAAGGVFVPLPEGARSRRTVMDQLATVMKELGAVTKEIAVITDPSGPGGEGITATERDRAVDRSKDLSQEVIRLVHELEHAE